MEQKRNVHTFQKYNKRLKVISYFLSADSLVVCDRELSCVTTSSKPSLFSDDWTIFVAAWWMESHTQTQTYISYVNKYSFFMLFQNN